MRDRWVEFLFVLVHSPRTQGCIALAIVVGAGIWLLGHTMVTGLRQGAMVALADPLAVFLKAAAAFFAVKFLFLAGAYYSKDRKRLFRL